MGFLKRQKRILTALAVFLAVMFFLTLVSKAVYVKGLPQVSVAMPERRSIVHSVQAEGLVVAGSEYAVNALPGLRISAVLVKPGDTVDEGTAILEVDTDDLSKVISEKEFAISSLEQQILDIEKNKSLTEKEREIQRQRTKEDYDRAIFEAQVRIARAREDFDAAKKKLKDFKGDDDSAEYELLKEAVRLCEQELQDAEWAAETAILETTRRAEDASFEGQSDSSLEIKKTELLQLKDELEKYQTILNDNGAIRAKRKGAVTRVNAAPGERTTDGAVLLFADLDAPVMFKASITKEDKKYINRGDSVKLDLGRYSAKEYSVDYLTEDGANGGLFEAAILLDKDGTFIGQSGTLSTEVKSEPYSCCIPVDALHEDSNHRKFIFIVESRAGILGDELAAQIVYVKVIDQNDSIAAIEASGMSGETQVITSASGEIKAGDVIRFKE